MEAREMPASKNETGPARSGSQQIGSLEQPTFAGIETRVPARNQLDQMTYLDVIRYRKESESAREHFLGHLNVLQAKHGVVAGDYPDAIATIVRTEIVPATRAFRNRLQAIDGALYGSVVKGPLGEFLGGSGLKIFGDLSCPSW